MLKKYWQIASAERKQVEMLAAALGLDVLLARLLVLRGINTAEAARDFLFGTVDSCPDPWQMKDMDHAVARTLQAIAKGEHIVVYGDYDVDGVTATTLLTRVLRQLGALVKTYIPDRQEEGYGVHLEALRKLRQDGCSLVITVDCGISAIQEASATGIPDLIITDHHEPGPTLPEAVAVLNPKRQDCSYPDKSLAGVGVAFKLAQALWKKLQPAKPLPGYCYELVAVGSVADMVPLQGETRLLVREGLKRLAKPECCGLEALLKVSSVKTPVSAGNIAFSLAPRLNAAGRMSLAQSSLQLLLSAEPEEAEMLAQELDEENKLRQETERSIVEAALWQCEEASLASQKVLLVAGENWHPGVIGIVASRLVERYYRPTIVLSLSEDGWAKGSCRSIPGFDMHEALQGCSHLLERFGGHKQAAGLTMRAEKVAALQEAMNQQAEQMLQQEDYVPKVSVDAVVSLDMVNEALLEKLELLEPYGIGNPRPRLLLQNLHLQGEARCLGKEKEHLKLTVRQNEATCSVLAWRQGEKACYLPQDTLLDVVATPEGNVWRDELQVQLVAEDFAPSRQEENQTKILDYLAPDMAGLRQLYAAMRHCLQLSNCQEGLTPEQLRRQLQQHCRLPVASSALAQALDVFSEVCLIAYAGETAKIALLPAPEKRLDITSTQGYEQGCLLRQKVLDKWLQRVEIQGLSQTWI